MNNNTNVYNELVEKQAMEAGASGVGGIIPERAEDYYRYNSTLDYDSDMIDTRVYADYTDSESVREIASCVYPRDMINSDWDFGLAGENDYMVYVYFKTDSPMTRRYGSSVNYVFPEGQIPDFVKNDTAYKE